MAQPLPADFPPSLVSGLDKVRRIHSPTWLKVVELIYLGWGDLDAIDKAKVVWTAEQVRASKSVTHLKNQFTLLANPDAVALWEGTARDAYASWVGDFQSATLERYLANIGSIISKLDEIRGNIFSLRGHLIAMAIEVIGFFAATTGTPIGFAVAVGSVVALLATYIDYVWRVKGDLEDKGNQLESFRLTNKIDRGDGTVSRPFKTDIIGDWSDWQNKK